jgi:trehalose/maltose hydrolase-like predicted phosphorylase
MNTLTRQANLIYTDWTLIEPEFDPAKLRARETVFTIGNGNTVDLQFDRFASLADREVLGLRCQDL